MKRNIPPRHKSSKNLSKNRMEKMICNGYDFSPAEKHIKKWRTSQATEKRVREGEKCQGTTSVV